MKHIRIAALAAALLLIACEVPVFPTDQTPEPATRIEGTIEVAVSNGLPLGPAVLTRYACDDPPPPLGTGSPVDFLIVAQEDFWQGEASFVFPSVPAESCSLIGGFIDRDRDFHYGLTITGQATAGDVWLDAVTVVTGAVEEDDWIEPSLDVRVRAQRLVEYDRPVFAIRPWEVPIGDDDVAEVMPFMELGETPGSTASVFFALDTTTFSTELLDVAAPVFSVVLGTDEDGDGMPDDDNGDTVPDVDEPTVLLMKVDPEDPLATLDPPVMLPGVVMSLDPTDPMNPATNLVMQALGAGIPLDGVTAMPLPSMILAVPGLVVTSLDPLLLTPIEEVAATGVQVTGQYRLMVMNPNGQLWYLPNELGAMGLESQAAFFEVVDLE